MRVACLIAAAVVLAGLADAGEVDLTVTPSDTESVASTPMTFVLEKSTMQAGAIRVWGEVRNETDKTYRFVRVVAKVRSAAGLPLGRTEWFVEPDTLAPGMSGHVTGARIACEGAVPKALEYSVLGNAVATGVGR